MSKLFMNADFIAAFREASNRVEEVNKLNGWHNRERPFSELVALAHSELSEALEYDRHGNPPSDHIPDFTGVEEELADLVIRIMDMGRRYRVAEAIIAKIEYNAGRGYKHGGKKY